MIPKYRFVRHSSMVPPSMKIEPYRYQIEDISQESSSDIHLELPKTDYSTLLL